MYEHVARSTENAGSTGSTGRRTAVGESEENEMILYFSGTGNSEYVAKRIAQQTGDEILNLFDKLRTEDNSPMESETPWVIVCPTYAWQMPRIVRDWLLATPLNGCDTIYFVLTCGNSIAGAGLYAKAVAAEKEMTYRGTAPVVMPENYIAMFETPDQEKALQIVDDAEDSIDKIADLISKGAFLEELGGGRLQSMTLNVAFNKLAVSDKKFVTNDDCTSCGQCVKSCVVENIFLDMDTRKPIWTSRCIHCMACINRCPFHAIEYGKVTENRERYRCPKTL